MDIASLSMAMNVSNVSQEASMSVMKMALDSAKLNASNMTEMLTQNKIIEQSVQPHLGGSVDVRL